MSKAREFWLGPDLDAYHKREHFDGDSEDLLHVREVRAGEVCITREELRAACKRATVFLDDADETLTEIDANKLEREIFGEAKDD